MTNEATTNSKATGAATTAEGLTELVFILDRSGSMGGLEDDTIGGFNAMLEKQKSQSGACFVSTVLFNNVSEVIHDRVKISKVRPLTREDYFVRGSTALLDAIGETIRHISDIHKYARAEDVPAHTMFIITTDGMENASHIYSSDKVKSMVEQQKSEHGWEFIFIGANIDAVETAGRFGISPERAVDYHADKRGTAVLYKSLSATVSKMRCGSAIQSEWCSEIKEDYAGRDKNQKH